MIIQYKSFFKRGWEDYIFWAATDKQVFKRINTLLEECMRTPFAGTGKPEPLKNELKGWWSRRITEEHRLIYRIDGEHLYILQCRYHYSQ